MGLIAAFPALDLEHFEYVSLHASSRISARSEREIVNQLKTVHERGIPVVVHPDIIEDFGTWRELVPIRRHPVW